MSLEEVLLGIAVVLGGAALLYGLYRFYLWLKKGSWKESSGSSPASCFVALQQVLEPPMQHVVQVREEKRRHGVPEIPSQQEPLPTEGEQEPK
jgi:hypothetical protein